MAVSLYKRAAAGPDVLLIAGRRGVANWSRSTQHPRGVRLGRSTCFRRSYGGGGGAPRAQNSGARAKKDGDLGVLDARCRRSGQLGPWVGLDESDVVYCHYLDNLAIAGFSAGGS